MELSCALRSRRMTRHFEDRAVPAELLAGMVELAARAPLAGNTPGVALLVLEGEAKRRFWEVTSDADWLSGPAGSGVSAAGAVVVPFCSKAAYLERYGQRDKAASMLGRLTARGVEWPVPMWWMDAAFAAMTLLLAATDAGLGSLFFTLHRGEAVVREEARMPEGFAAAGGVAIGWPAAGARAKPSRSRPPPEEMVHWGRFGCRRPE